MQLYLYIHLKTHYWLHKSCKSVSRDGSAISYLTRILLDLSHNRDKVQFVRFVLWAAPLEKGPSISRRNAGSQQNWDSAERVHGLTVYNRCTNREEAQSDAKMHLLKEIFLKERMSPLKINEDCILLWKKDSRNICLHSYLDFVKYFSLSFSSKEIAVVP